ncbi:thiamine phosphate synthase [Alkalicoccus chagannorensis]|uniref:thiamine phosphate synthase n=1 Tax=Alkalicoccus chagannorensis TaxID=427072 RepID=UPI00040F7EB2|nr:thiamine phosphate synthase [Alkalicoccus chagannorensis]
MIKFHKEQLRLYFISGTRDTLRRPLPKVLDEALDGGVTMFQFREKGIGVLLTHQERVDMALKLKARCHDRGVPFIVNDDIKLAEEVDADGVHIGQDDAPADQVRAYLGEDKILGVSAYTVEEAEKAVRDGADYLGVGPMYATSSKNDAKEVVGPERIAEMRRAGITIPITAIGGIMPEHTAVLRQAGADGLSVISAVARQEKPLDAAAVFAWAWREMDS